jgi:DNA-binding IclR family transcriptional regulator
MKEDAVPNMVQEFLRQHIESFEHLEVLLLLLRHHGQTWTAAAVAEHLQIEFELVSSALSHLTRQDLLRQDADGTAGFRYGPGTAKLEAEATALAKSYMHDRVRVILLMNEHAVTRIRLSALRTFAEAFRLRGREEER